MRTFSDEALEELDAWLMITLFDATTCAHLYQRGLLSWPHVRKLIWLVQGRDLGPVPDWNPFFRQQKDTIDMPEEC